MKIEGGCHCGFITFEAEVEPEKTSMCHCIDCQMLSGAPFRASVPVQDSAFRLLSGEPKPSLAAWQFPLSCTRSGKDTLVWGRAPGPGPVIVERRAGAGWRSVRTVDVGRARVFRLRLSGRPTVRGRATTMTSRSCQ